MTLKPLKECRVLVTPTSYGKEEPALRTRFREPGRGSDLQHHRETADALRPAGGADRGVDGYIAGLDMISAGVIEAADCLKVIAPLRRGVGCRRPGGCKTEGHHRHQYPRGQFQLGG